MKNSKKYKQYSKELKEQAVLEYLFGENSKEEIIKKYEISSRSVLSRWIKRYNSHREFKDTGNGMSKSMTKGRTAT